MTDSVQDRIKTWIFGNLDRVFPVLRRVKPTLVLGGQAFVTRFDGVDEVLASEDVFEVPYAEKMAKVTGGGNFFLGMQNTPVYARDVTNMRLAVRREDIPDRIVPFVESACADILSRADGELDVVESLTRVVPTRLIGDYFGTPGWDTEEFADAASTLFAYLFYPASETFEAKALADARITCNYLDGVIRERKLDRHRRDDVLERCLAMQDDGRAGMTDVDIRNNLIGLLIGAIATTSKCAALTLDHLFDHPKRLATAARAARQDDDAMMLQYVRECLRLNPFAAGVQRICARDHTLGEGSWRRTRIPAGTSVLVATQSAMMDARRVERPREFRLDRPDDVYLHYGVGRHTCFGRHINDAQIPAIVKAVLRLEGLRRVEPMRTVGPFPVSLKVAFDTGPARPTAAREVDARATTNEAAA